jgi:hypothetical protein
MLGKEKTRKGGDEVTDTAFIIGKRKLLTP